MLMDAKMSLVGANKPKKKGRTFNVQIQTMDAQLEFPVDSKILGKELFELVCKTLGLRETTYFDLQFLDTKGYVSWLKPERKVLEQDITKETPVSFLFLSKFYPEDVSEELIQAITQHLFFLQVKQSIVNMDIYCPPEASVLLASYAVQAQYGDYDESTYQQGMLANESLLPQRVIDQYQMTPEMWAERIKVWYGDHQGMTRDEAEMEYLKIAQDLEMYGVNYFQIKNKKDTDLWLGVDSLGLNIYEANNKLTPKINFPWSDIKDISFKDRKFIIKNAEKKSPDFVFLSPKIKLNKLIIELCEGNHELFMLRRKPDSMEVQQMKAAAKEEKQRRVNERAKLDREKKLREEAQREKEELYRQVQQLQEECAMAREALARSEETADLLAEKCRLAEEEAMLLTQKAAEAESEIRRIKISAIKTEEEKNIMEQRARDAELIAAQIVEDSEKRKKEAEALKEELLRVRLAEKLAKDKLAELASRNTYSNLYVQYNGVTDLENSETTGLDDDIPLGDMDQLSLEMERERVEYLEKSKHVQTQLKELKDEMEVLKLEEKQTTLDRLHEENVQRGDNKKATLQKIRSGTTQSRVAFFEEL